MWIRVRSIAELLPPSIEQEEVIEALEETRNDTPLLHAAALLCTVEVVKRLLELGLNVHSRDPANGTTLLHMAALNSQHGVQMVQFLLGLGLSKLAVDDCEKKPIDFAHDAQNESVYELLSS
ncbi:Hypothetical predicted protein [Cloeon dipterum]|uniref:Uncharacterized protein n=1 Tax=Cloeon dipterum TaxID=197152 RepID=A0A8S1CG47_9INSE|nr:Hypothetical predicted protein [Cloeon dipterum]